MIEEIDGKPYDFKKGVIKFRFDSDDDLPLIKILKVHNVTIVFRSIFEEDDKYYPQISIDECLYEL